MNHRLLPTVLLLFPIGLLQAKEPAAQTELAKLAISLKPGEWAKLATQNYTRELVRASNHNIYEYTHDGQWDPVRGEFLMLGQGHYSDLKMIVYSASENRWSTLETPPWWKIDSEKGRGPIGHAYDNNALDVKGRIYYHQQYNSPHVHRFDVDQRRWIKSLTVDTSGGFQKGGHSSALSYFPEMNGLVRAHSNGHVDLFDAEAQKWKAISRRELPLNQMNPFAQYNPIHKCVLFGGGNDTRKIFRLDADGQISDMASAPLESLDCTHRFVIAVDPVGGDMLVIVNRRESEHFGKLFALDLEKNAWRRVSESVPCKGLMVGASLADHGVIMVCSYRPEEVWLYRHEKP